MPQTWGPTVQVGNKPNRPLPVFAVSSPPPGMQWKGYEQVSSLVSAHSLTPPADASVAVIKVEAGNVRYLNDQDPTASVGMPLWGTETLTLTAEIESYRFINMTGSTATLNVVYYG